MNLEFMLGLLSVVTINLILSCDNALVIALASRNLPAEQQKYAIFFGGAGAIILRVILTFAAVYLLYIPYLQLLGGLLLLWIACKLAWPKNGSEEIVASSNLGEVIRTIIVADVIMSLDNVVATAGVAKGNLSLLVAGLGISIPIIIWGSRFIQRLIIKWPLVIAIGSAFLGWTAGDMIGADPVVRGAIGQSDGNVTVLAAIVAAVLFVIAAFAGKRRRML